MNDVRLRRLRSDHDAVRRLAERHPRIDVEGSSGNPPDRYRLILHVRSLRERGDRPVIARRHRLEVRLPNGYPRDAPLCRMLTPVFHPNIAPHAVCIGDHWSAAESLDFMIQRVGEMLAFQSYNVKSPLNGKAAQWVEEHLDHLPLEDEEFFIDLGSATPVETATDACTNCGATGGELQRCAADHPLCPECVANCETCGRLLCLVCGTTACPVCTKSPCANCGAAEPDAATCATGHALCTDCAIDCESCGRALCVVCGEFPCATCAK